MKWVFTSVLLFCALNAYAQPTWHTSKVKSIYPLADGRVVVSFVSESADCKNTSSPKYYYLGVGVNGVLDQGFKNMYSALLAAAASGKDVTINFESASDGCDINRLSVAF